MHVFLAEGLAPVARRLEAGEEIEVVVMDVEELREIVRRGELEDGKSLAAFHLFLEHLRSGDAP